MTQKLRFITMIILLGLGLSACSGGLLKASPTPEPSPTAEPTLTPTFTPTLAPTETPSPTETATLVPTPTLTKVPFDGFMPNFSLYRAWEDQGKTFIYFLQADFPGTIYARADTIELLCNPDPKYPLHMICESAQALPARGMMTFTFFTDSARQDLVFTKDFSTGLADNTVWHNQFDCPDRGKNVTCESEYRLYDGRCYYAHTCYDACGLYYSNDNLPKVWKEFQGYTSPCN